MRYKKHTQMINSSDYLLAKYFTEEEQKMYEEFIHDFMKSSNTNEGAREFDKNDIAIDEINKVITITLDPNKKNDGVENFQTRGESDKTFLSNFSQGISPIIDFENRMFNLTLSPEEKKDAEHYKHPLFGGRLVFTQTSIYCDNNTGRTYTLIPIALSGDIYSQGSTALKVSGSNVFTGSANIKPERIVSSLNPLKTSGKITDSLARLQQKNKKEKIIEELPFQFGEWTLRFKFPGKHFSPEIKGVHIGRAYDRAIEVITSKMFESYEDFLSSYTPEENIGYTRPVILVDTADLLDFSRGKTLKFKKLFYNNQECSPNELPDKFSHLSFSGNTLTNTTFTPPFEMFLGKLKTIILSTVFKKTVEEILENSKQYREEKPHKAKTVGDTNEKAFAKKYKLSKNVNEIRFGINIPRNYKDIINLSDLSEHRKKSLITFIEKKRVENLREVNVNPDFIIPLENNKNLYIDTKTSLRAKKTNNLQLKYIELLLLFGDHSIQNYTFIISGDTGINIRDDGEGILKVSQSFLDQEQINTSSKLVNFLTNK